MIDHRGPRRKSGRYLAGECALVLTCNGAPEQHLAAAYHDSNLGSVDLTVTLHLLLDARAQLRIGWGNLAHSRAMVERMHGGARCNRHALFRPWQGRSSHEGVARGRGTRARHVGAARRDRRELSIKRRSVPPGSAGMCVADSGSMAKPHSRLLTTSALIVLASVLSVAAACTHTSSERVVEPVGGGDASTTTPEVGDAGVSPIGPIARPIEPDEDFRLVRAPEFGLVPLTRDSAQVSWVAQPPERRDGSGGIHAGGSVGVAGSDLRPVATGGNY